MTSPRYAELPRPTMPGTTIPSGTPTDADGRSTRVKGAKELRKVTGRVTGTYTAYGVTENFYKDCAHQAEYTIPQAADPDAEIPKTDDGEDLGVGESLWHTGMHFVDAWMLSIGPPFHFIFLALRGHSIHNTKIFFVAL